MLGFVKKFLGFPLTQVNGKPIFLSQDLVGKATKDILLNTFELKWKSWAVVALFSVTVISLKFLAILVMEEIKKNKIN